MKINMGGGTKVTRLNDAKNTKVITKRGKWKNTTGWEGQIFGQYDNDRLEK